MSLLKIPEKSPYIFLLFLVAIISVTSFKNSFLLIDDLTLIVNNPKLGFSLHEILAIFSKPLAQIYEASDYTIKFNYYRPALNLLYMFNNAVWGINPVGFHITNLLLHLLTTILIYRTGLILFNQDKTFSLLAAAIFCVHPVNNELIGRVAMNENLLGVFIALSFNCYLNDKKYQALFAFIMALLSKESAVMLPFVFCLFELRKKGFKDALLSLKPFLVAVVVYLALRTVVVGIPDNFSINRDFSEVVFTACSALADYLRLLLVPYPLNIYYPVLNFTTFSQSVFLISSAICLILVVVIWKVRSDELLLPLLAGTVIMLAPVILMANKLILGSSKAYIAERQLYVPLIFFSLFIGGILMKYTANRSRKLATSGLFIIVIMFSFTTATACAVWENDDSFSIRFSQEFPKHYYSHEYRGRALLKSGNLDGAMAEFIAVLPPTPKSSVNHDKDATIKNSVKTLASLSGLLDNLGIAAYQSEFAEIHSLIGEVYLAKGDTARAIKKFRTALVLAPKTVSARAHLAEVYLRNGMVKDAQREYRLVLASLSDKH